MIKILNKIKSYFSKKDAPVVNTPPKEAWELIDVSPLIKNGVLVMDENASYEVFYKVCVRAKDQNIEFDKILISPTGYLRLHQEMAYQIPNAVLYNNLIKPFTQDGLQTLEGLKNPVSGKNIWIYTAREKSIIN
jgi:hypothetical protein